MMKRLWIAVVVLTSVAALMGCGKTTRVDTPVGTAYVRVEYAPQFTAAPLKYDEALRKAHEINQSLAEAEFYLGSFTDNMQKVVGDVIDLAGMSVKEALQAWFDHLKSQGIIIGVRAYVSGSYTYFEVVVIEPDLIPEDVQESIDAFQIMIKSIPMFVDSLAEAVETSAELATDITGLVSSLDTDFTGLNVTKIPAATKALTSTASELAEVPGRVTDLVAQAKETMEAVLEVLGMD